MTDASASIFAGRDVLIVAAHPDDETLFCGAQFAHCRSLSIIHTTDGANSTRVARKHGFPNRQAYAAARRLELRAALSAGGISAATSHWDYRDQTLSFNMVEAALRLVAAIDSLKPDLVLTHAYEAGHRDHDATALIVHSAMKRTAHRVPVWEFAGYHRANGNMRVSCFASAEPSGHRYQLTEAELKLKRSMLQRFHTQRAAVEMFSTAQECFRPAPRYDFTKPPVGPDYADGIPALLSPTKIWCLIAKRALAELDLNPRTGLAPLALRVAYRVAGRIWKFRGCPYATSMQGQKYSAA